METVIWILVAIALAMMFPAVGIAHWWDCRQMDKRHAERMKMLRKIRSGEDEGQ